MPAPICFDAVVFDLDGTLVATERFWAQAARTGTRRAYAELGLAGEPPEASAWMSLVGEPLELGIARLFPHLDAQQRARVQAACVEEEHRRLSTGTEGLMNGAAQLLGELAEAGLAIGVASNCSQAYLDHWLAQAPLDRTVTAARCAESPGVRNKADMLESLLGEFGTRSAVMVGDRSTDRDAARANAIPFVHCAFGYGTADRVGDADAVIQDPLELRARLARRGQGIAAILDRCGILRPQHDGGARLGITGGPASGKSLLARDVVRWLASTGRAARTSTDPQGPVADGELLVIDGMELLEPSQRQGLARLIALDVAADVARARWQARSRGCASDAALHDLLRSSLPAWQERCARYPLERSADLVVQGANPLEPTVRPPPDEGAGS
jgi:phosphoglycolate phosphatase-like HAD superfamily hydrolase